MKLSDLVKPAAIRVPLTATSKEESIAELVVMLEESYGIESHGEVLSRIIARESLMSTGIGSGVAIPHAKARAVKSVVVSAGVAAHDLDYDAIDGEPVRLVFLLVSPESERGPHVRALAAITRLVQDGEVRRRLLSAVDAATFYQVLLAAELHGDHDQA